MDGGSSFDPPIPGGAGVRGKGGAPSPRLRRAVFPSSTCAPRVGGWRVGVRAEARAGRGAVGRESRAVRETLTHRAGTRPPPRTRSALRQPRRAGSRGRAGQAGQAAPRCPRTFFPEVALIGSGNRFAREEPLSYS